MHNEVKHAVYIAIELIVTASIIAVIAAALYMGSTLKNIRANEKASKAFMEEQAIFYKYMNESGELTGSDVVDIMATYSRVYDFIVVYKVNDNIEVTVQRKSSNTLNDWSVDNLEKSMESVINDKYSMKQVLTLDGYAIKAIIFENTSNSSWTDSDVRKIVTKFLKYKDYSYK